MYVIVFCGEKQRAAHVYTLVAVAPWIEKGQVFITHEGLLYPIRQKDGEYGFWVRGTWKEAPADTYR